MPIVADPLSDRDAITNKPPFFSGERRQYAEAFSPSSDDLEGPDATLTIPSAQPFFTSDLAVDTTSIESNKDKLNSQSEFDFVKPKFDPIIRRRIRKELPNPETDIRQQWEGVVSEVGSECFWADVSDITNPTNPKEHVEFSLEQVPPGDRSLLVAGAVFYWIVGFDRARAGNIRGISEIRFRRSPKWTLKKLDEVNKKAEALFERFFQDERRDPASE